MLMHDSGQVGSWGVAVNVGMEVEVWGLQATLQSIVQVTTGLLVRILS